MGEAPLGSKVTLPARHQQTRRGQQDGPLAGLGCLLAEEANGEVQIDDDTVDPDYHPSDDNLEYQQDEMDQQLDDSEEHIELCRGCVDEVMSLLPVAHVLTRAVPYHDPPPRLRARVIQAIPGAPPAAPVDPSPPTGGAPRFGSLRSVFTAGS